jgi:hypothetical protein
VNGDVTASSGSVWLLVLFGLPLVLLGGFIALIVFLIRRFTLPGVPVAASAIYTLPASGPKGFAHAHRHIPPPRAIVAQIGKA